jgi:hypothetical protein
MGFEATGASTTLTTGGRTYRGTARLEDTTLVFRGDTRLVIPLASIHDLHARDGDLFLRFGDQRAVLHLGPAADAWARRITNPPSRVAKLGIKPGMRVALVNLADETLEAELRGADAVVEAGAGARDLDALFVGVARPDDLERLAPLAARIHDAGALWVVRRKGAGAPVTEAASMAAGRRAGLVDVKVVRYSGTHSAEKYMIPRSARAARPARPRDA